MLRKIAYGVFAICLAFWCLLAIVLWMAFVAQGWTGVVGKLIHLAGITPDFRNHTLGYVVWRLVGIFVITLGTGYFSRSKQPEVASS
jgi:hypothetical protein